jgi:biopolymer transport protein TolQ
MPDTSLWSFIANAGYVVKFVMLILLMASLASWTIIFQRIKQVRELKNAIQLFETQFWAGVDMQKFFDSIKDSETREGLAPIFYAGFKAFQRLSAQPGATPTAILEGTQRAMRIAHQQELEGLEKNLTFLATVGSTSPYVGLFGTVWGIMTSFQALGTVQQATIAMVAPGISEALIATAIGLFAAIPAVIAYNRFNTSVDVFDNQFQIFQEELSGIFHFKLLEAQDAK